MWIIRYIKSVGEYYQIYYNFDDAARYFSNMLPSDIVEIILYKIKFDTLSIEELGRKS